MNEKPLRLTQKCKPARRFHALFYPMMLIISILLMSISPVYLQAQSTTALSFSAIPMSDPDIVAPFRGTEKWHDMSASDRIDYPVQGGHQEPGDAYYRSGISWNVLESSQGVYNWTVIDRLINACIDKNQKFNFNVMTLHPGSSDGIYAGGANMKYPLYVHNQMQADGGNNTDWIKNGQWVPNWNSNFFLTRVEALLSAMASHFNSTSYNGVSYAKVIGYVDIGIFGSWGEWNHSSIINSPSEFPTGRQATAASLNRIIDAHIKAFPNYPLIANMHVFDGNQFANVQVPPATGYYALTVSNAWGKLGVKRMNWGRGWEYYVLASTLNNPTVYNGLRFGTEISERWKYAPINGEGPCYTTAEGGNAPFWNLMNEVQTNHMSSLGNGNFCGEQNNPTGVANLRAALKMAGYRVVVESGSMTTDVKTNQTTNITLNWKNIGNAPVYEFWDVMYELQNRSTNAVVWSTKSSHNLRFWLPQSTATQVSDNFTIPSSVPAGTYKIVLKVVDQGGYRRPLPLAIRGRLSDGGYLLRDNVNVTAGTGTTTPVTPTTPTGVSVNAGQDQTVANGTSQTNLSGTLTGANTSGKDTVNLIVIQGESNAAGMALNTQATSAELSARANVYILNNNNLQFQNLQIGVNNNILQNLGDQTTHGLELGLANAIDAGKLSKPTYLVKAAGSGSTIYEWLSNGTSNGNYGWNSMVNRMDAAINYLKNQGIPYKITVWQSIGINDYNAGTSATTYRARIEQFRNEFRARYGQSIAFLMTHFVTNHPYNTVIDQIAANDPQKTSAAIDVTGATFRDQNIHWDYAGLKIIAGRMVDKMASSSSSVVAVTTVWSKVSGPTGGNISSTSSLSTSITGLQAGTYVYRLTANGSSGVLATDDITIVVSAASNAAPVADAGNNITITLPTSAANFSGTGSDADGSIRSYGWSQVSGPGTAVIGASNAASTSISALVQGSYVFRLTVTDDKGATATDDITVTVNAAATPPTAGNGNGSGQTPIANQPPTVNAGNSTTITLPTNSVSLNGTAEDIDGSIVTWAWTVVSGTGATISPSNQAKANISGLAAGNYVFRLTVTDNKGASAYDDVSVFVNEPSNQPPVANAGINFTTSPGTATTLNGSASKDPDGTITAFLWKQVSGPNTASFNQLRQVTATTSNLIVGTYVFSLTVTDNRGALNTANVTVTVVAASNGQPVIVTKDTIKVNLPASGVELDARDSYDPDGKALTYRWDIVSAPNLPSVSDPENALTNLNDLVEGTYTMRLTVTDVSGASTTKNVIVIVANPDAQSLKVYPNPATTNVNVQLNSKLTGKTLLRLYSMSGVIVYSEEFQKNSDVVTKTINVSGLTSGTYVMTIATDNAPVITKKIQKIQ